jgi:hypothetical protein
MIYSTDGVGKTILSMMIAQLITPPDKKIAFVDAHNGWKVINNPRWKARNLGKRTQPFQYQGWSQLQTLSQLIQANHKDFNYGCVILDELSYMEGIDIQRVHTQHVAAGKKDTDEDVPGWGEYNPAKNRYKKMMDDLLEAGTHIIAVSHRREEFNKAKQLIITPDFIPSIRKEILRPFDFCGYLTADMVTAENDPGKVQYERKVQVHPTKLITAKTKIDDLPLNVSATDLPVIIQEWIAGERTTAVEDNSVFNDPSTILEDDDYQPTEIA